jgi:hypothetical protein
MTNVRKPKTCGKHKEERMLTVMAAPRDGVGVNEAAQSINIHKADLEGRFAGNLTSNLNTDCPKILGQQLKWKMVTSGFHYI